MGKSKYNIDLIKDEFAKENYILLTTNYINMEQDLHFICNKHNDKGIQTIKYKDFKNRNRRCKYCTKEKIAKRDRMPIEKIKEKLNKIGLIFVDVLYPSATGKSSTVVQYICPNHEYIGVQEKNLSTIMNKKNNGCPYCNRVMDTFTFKERLRKIQPNIKVIGEYKGQNEKILCKCIVHNEEFYGIPRKLYEGNISCPKCKYENLRNRQLLTHNQFVKKLESVKPEIKVVGRYIDSTTPILMYCMIHNKFFYESPNTYLYKKKKACCPFENVQKKSNEQFKKELKKVTYENIIPLEEYKGYNTKIKFKCLDHDYEWISTPNKVLSSKKCPMCSISKNEIYIIELLKSLHINYIHQKRFEDCRDQKVLPFDFYLPDYNLCIEYDGEGHYLESFYERSTANTQELLLKTQKHDQIKTNYCNQNNIELLRIPYWEQENLENMIKNKINMLIPR